MHRKPPTEVEAPIPPGRVAAGDFSIWLRTTEASLRSGSSGANVPCGTCRGCCRSSMFIHIRPDESKTLRRIPRALLFPAPGLPKGHVLMGYDDKGQCPMLIDEQCSIYEDRPQTCRDYDCRVFAATGIDVDPQTQAEIAGRVDEWLFSYETQESHHEQAALKAAAAFLKDNRDLFPQQRLPSYPVQLAALAVRVYTLFSDRQGNEDGPPQTDAAIAQAILTMMSELPNEQADRLT